MKYEAGNRFTPETYLKTEAESGTTVSLKVTGELEGVEVSFDSGDVPELTTLSATENRTYEAPEGTAYNEVTVNVPNSYTAEDEGKVVDQGALVSQTSTTKTANGTYDTTTNNEVVVEVANSYTAADEGKVVSSGALVAQTSTTKTANGTYDTTLNNEVVVNVSGSIDIGSLLGYGALPDADITVPYISGKNLMNGPFSRMLFEHNTHTIKFSEGITDLKGPCGYSNPRVIDIPSTVTAIGSLSSVSSGSGESCSIICRATTPPSVAFVGANIDAIYVPSEVVETYKTSPNWTSKASIIQAIPTT